MEREFTWVTEHSHPDNTYTMNEFIELYADDFFLYVYDVDRTFAIGVREDGTEYEIHAGGDGDFNHHKMTFRRIHGR